MILSAGTRGQGGFKKCLAEAARLWTAGTCPRFTCAVGRAEAAPNSSAAGASQARNKSGVVPPQSKVFSSRAWKGAATPVGIAHNEGKTDASGVVRVHRSSIEIELLGRSTGTRGAAPSDWHEWRRGPGHPARAGSGPQPASCYPGRQVGHPAVLAGFPVPAPTTREGPHERAA